MPPPPRHPLFPCVPGTPVLRTPLPHRTVPPGLCAAQGGWLPHSAAGRAVGAQHGPAAHTPQGPRCRHPPAAPHLQQRHISNVMLWLLCRQIRRRHTISTRCSMLQVNETVVKAGDSNKTQGNNQTLLAPLHSGLTVQAKLQYLQVLTPEGQGLLGSAAAAGLQGHVVNHTGHLGGAWLNADLKVHLRHAEGKGGVGTPAGRFIGRCNTTWPGGCCCWCCSWRCCWGLAAGAAGSSLHRQ